MANEIPEWARVDNTIPDWAKQTAPAQPQTPLASSTVPVATPEVPVYKPFSKVRTDIDPTSLNTDPDWIAASKRLYEVTRRTPFSGTDSEAAEYGKDAMGMFNYNLVAMGVTANAIVERGDQTDKEAFLFLMDTYDNTNVSWEGTGRFFTGIATDPTTYVGLSTLGAGLIGKGVAKESGKAGIKELLKRGIGRTGVVAGLETGIVSAADNTVRQGIEVAAGRKSELSLTELAAKTAIGTTAGVVLGTSADVAVSKITQVLTKEVPTAKVEPKLDANAQVDPAVDTKVEPTMDGVVPEVKAPAKPTLDPKDDVLKNGGYVIPVDEVAKVGDGANSPWLTAEGKVVGTGQDHLSVISENSDTYSEHMLKTGDIRAAFYEDAVEGYVITLHVAEGQNLTAKQIDTIKEISDARGGDVKILLGEKNGLVNPDYAPVTIDDLLARSRNPKLGDNLTAKEIADAEARRQQGRLPEDTPPNLDGKTSVDLYVPNVNTGVRNTPVNLEAQGEQAKVISDQLRVLNMDELVTALEQVRTGSWTFDQVQLLSRGIQQHAQEVKVEMAQVLKQLKATPGDEKLTEKLAALEARDAAIMADDAIGSFSGSLLRQRQEGLGLEGLTVEKIMAEQGVTEEIAQQIFADMVAKAESNFTARQITQKYTIQINKALADGDLTKVVTLTMQKNRELTAHTGKVVGGDLPEGQGRIAKFVAQATELAISNVFSFKTLMINMIPSGIKALIVPSLRAILTNPLEKATRVRTAAAYSAMRSNFKGALSAARAAYRYESSILTGDVNKITESTLQLPGRIGGVLRFFPRALNASDEFLAQLTYSSYVAGEAAANAAIEGAQKGLKGAKLDAFIDKATKSALDAAYKPTTGDELVTPIINKGMNLGLTGEELFAFVEREAMRNPKALRKGNDKEAVEFVQDVLYKRQFSGKSAASSGAQYVDEGLRRFPTIKLLIGQLFYRTPLRVFEEGIRITPGLQFIAPGFLNDLRGLNGGLRQVRAQAESMVSLSAIAAVVALYGQGRITGDLAYSDYRQSKLRSDGGKQEPYTIDLGDGNTWNYRSVDPIATPLKIMVNALERYDRYLIRVAQGEMEDKKAAEQVLAAVTIATGAITQAIRDAGLVEGADNSIKFLESLADPEEASWVKLLGDKLFLLVPNTLHKIAKTNDPTIKDPRDFWQMVEERLYRPVGYDSKEILTAYSYDVLGNVRRYSDTGAMWNVFSVSTPEERAKGLSEKELFVLQEMDRLAQVTNLVLKPPVSRPELGDIDLRTVLALDGKRTLYDVWQQNYRDLNPADVLYPIMSAPLPDGTAKHKGVRVETLRQQINNLQEVAFQQMMVGEQRIIDRMVSEELKKIKSKAGLFDIPR